MRLWQAVVWRVLGYKGKKWRLRKDGLDKEIDPAGSRVKVGKQEHDHGRSCCASQGPVRGRPLDGPRGQADHRRRHSRGPLRRPDDMMKQMYDEYSLHFHTLHQGHDWGDLGGAAMRHAWVTSAVRQ